MSSNSKRYLHRILTYYVYLPLFLSLKCFLAQTLFLHENFPSPSLSVFQPSPVCLRLGGACLLPVTRVGARPCRSRLRPCWSRQAWVPAGLVSRHSDLSFVTTLCPLYPPDLCQQTQESLALAGEETGAPCLPSSASPVEAWVVSEGLRTDAGQTLGSPNPSSPFTSCRLRAGLGVLSYRTQVTVTSFSPGPWEVTGRVKWRNAWKSLIFSPVPGTSTQHDMSYYYCCC